MPIANFFFIVRFLDYIRRETEYEEDDIDMMRYSLEAILWEIEKTIYFFFIFLLLGYHWQFLASLLAVITIRPTAGGFHSSTVWGCFFWTLLGFVLAFFALPQIPLADITVVLVSIFSIFVTFIATPVRSIQMEKIADKSKDKQKKMNQSFFLTESVIWIIFLQNVQLLIEYLKRKTKNIKD